MPEESPLEKKELHPPQEKGLLALISFLTIQPVGNPLLHMTGAQRQFFFESLLNMLHAQRVENKKRAEALLPRELPLAAGTAGVHYKISKNRQREKEAAEAEERRESGAQWTKKGASEKHGGDFSFAFPIAEKKPMPEHEYSALGGLAGSAAGMTIIPLAAGASLKNNPNALFSALYGKKAREVHDTQERLSEVIDDYARGDETKTKAAIADFKLRLSMEDYKPDELMAVLLLVIEDHIWAEQESEITSAKPSGMGAKAKSAIPAQLRETMKESASVRLASVREMLRYYFERHPKEYASALAAALGMTTDQEEDRVFLQERLASELASIGGFALSQKILAEIKRKKKMGTKECLRELGYKYDRKSRKLILGKRTCGSPAEARGIVELLMAGFRRSGEPSN